ncbi:hypothetical protein Q5424_08075 [Conexibacter sp. JD483]|uniref:hypothetical protein n=1 Tax=unclassified Conexibacter TaxID=2627773 RepID=UPI002727E698|nr:MULTISPECIES: hypothetical protein [unclassified Conexibacter]MDO8184772.1 hypothetical protein [Conexibacter sp. CPCC 205706]MDO8196547.1 hypothetical protein [Conexibacter sp. CPCC 205762]MDR9369033.1 hypothetical protein [Conexibacter sp. JD483]
MADESSPTEQAAKPQQRGPASVSANRVAAIISAAEDTAARLREDAEQRLRERIAEADRAADNRVTAAEDEAAEIIAEARRIAERLVLEARGEAARMKTLAGAESGEIRAVAEQEAREIRREAEAWAAERRADGERRARDLASEARVVAGEVRAEGLELTENLRELGGSLRSNAERLMRDIVKVHHQLAAHIDHVDPGPAAVDSSPRRRERERDLPRSSRDSAPRNGTRRRADDDLDVPEFIPQR